MAGFSQVDPRYAPLPMTHEWLAEVAALVGAAGAVLVLLGPARRMQLAVGFVLLAAAMAMLVVALLPSDDLDAARVREGLAALVVGAGVAVAGAWAFVRYPATVPVALLLAAPFRLPVELGSQDAFLLLPLYVVLAAASLALLYRAMRGEELAAIPLWIAAPGAALIGWASLSLLWALDPEEGSIALLFFLFPFAALLAVVRDRRMRNGCRGRLPSASSAWLPSSPSSVSTRRGHTPSSSLRTCASPTRTRRTSASRPSSRTRASTAASSCSR